MEVLLPPNPKKKLHLVNSPDYNMAVLAKEIWTMALWPPLPRHRALATSLTVWTWSLVLCSCAPAIWSELHLCSGGSWYRHVSSKSRATKQCNFTLANLIQPDKKYGNILHVPSQFPCSVPMPRCHPPRSYDAQSCERECNEKWCARETYGNNKDPSIVNNIQKNSSSNIMPNNSTGKSIGQQILSKPMRVHPLRTLLSLLLSLIRFGDLWLTVLRDKLLI